MVSSIAFIGIGAMGAPMVAQIDEKLPKEAKICVYDVVESQIEKVLSASKHQRIIRGNNAYESADSSATILTMLPEGRHVLDCYTNAETGILNADLEGKLVIDCSTIDIESSQHVARNISQKYPNAKFCDAPVSGGVVGAEKGSLTFMVGCREDDLRWDEIKSLLEMMGSAIFACGAPTQGIATKLCNNYLSGTIAIAASETMNMGIRMGLDPVRLSEIFKTSTAQNAILDKFHPVPGVVPTALSSNGYKGGFKVQLMRKDYDLAIEAARKADAQLVLGQAGLATYEGASKDPHCRDLDSRVVYRYLGGIENWQAKQ